MAHGVISPLANLCRQLALPLLSLADQLNHLAEGVLGLPPQLLHRLARVVHPVDALQIPPSLILEDLPAARCDGLEHLLRVPVELLESFRVVCKRRRRADDVLFELQRLCLGHAAHGGSDDVLDVASAVGQLQDLEVVVVQRCSAVLVVVLLGEEAARAQDEDGHARLFLHEEAEVLGGDLGGAVYVLGDGDDRLVDPRGCEAGLGAQGRAKGAGGAEEDEALDLGAELGGLLEEHEGARDVCVDKVLLGVALHVGLVQRGGVEDVLDGVLREDGRHGGAVGDGDDVVGVV